MHALKTPITTLAQAEAWAAAAPELASLPTFSQYKEGLETFLRESAEWEELDRFRFYSVNRFGYTTRAATTPTVAWTFRGRSQSHALSRRTTPSGCTITICPRRASCEPYSVPRPSISAFAKKTGPWQKKRNIRA